MILPHDANGRECPCTRCIMAVRSEIDRAARGVLLSNLHAVLTIRRAEMVGESYQRRLEAGLEPLRQAGVRPA